MAISNLQVIPQPPAGFPVTRQQQTQFVNDYMILSPPNLDIMDRKTIRILGLIAALNKARGIDYRSNFPQLIADAAAFTNGISMLDLDVALTAVEWSNGSVADATLSSSLDALCQAGRIFEALNEDQCNRIIALLEVRIAQ